MGISEEIKDRIFDRGIKGKKSSGSGIGLFLTQKIANKYGGNILVMESELGGARFDVILKKAS